MKLTQVRGNTWVLDSWELIPLYKLDDHRCVLLDTGTVEQREELEETLDEAGLTPVAILGSHTHIDHMGSHAYFQKTRGTQVVMSLGEAGQIFSPLGLQLQYNNFPMALFPDYPELGTAPLRARPGDPPGGGGRHPLRGHLRHPPHPGPHRGPHLRAHPR